MENIDVIEKINQLVDKYFTDRTEEVLEYSNSIRIRKSLEERVGEYFQKSLLNEILMKKKFKFKKVNNIEYIYNISKKDMEVLSFSNTILTQIKNKYDYPYNLLVKSFKLKMVNEYKYTFRFLIKINFHARFHEKKNPENMVYKVLSKELGISEEKITNYLNIFNLQKSADIPEKILNQLLDIFEIDYKQCITNKAVYVT